ncbi:MAG: nucleotide-binding domain containing protein [Pseudomonadota bacterium]
MLKSHIAPDLLGWAQDAGELPLIATSADPGALAAVQTRYGRDRAAAAVESFFAALARGAQGAGFTRIITAGGETSGAVVEGLSLGALTIGPEIDPGVPALRAHGDLVLALKSGNFGAPDFFEKAARVLGS